MHRKTNPVFFLRNKFNPMSTKEQTAVKLLLQTLHVDISSKLLGLYKNVATPVSDPLKVHYFCRI